MNRWSIEINNLTKIIDGKEIIKNCDLKVKTGSIYGFLGPNGAGKTTIFKLIIGLLNSTSGTISVSGLDSKVNREEILRRVGSIIEVPIFYDHLTVKKNLAIHLDYMNLENNAIEETLKKVGLLDAKDQLV